MTLVQAATELGVAPSTLRKQRQNGKLRCYKLGRNWYVTDDEVQRYRVEHRGKGQAR